MTAKYYENDDSGEIYACTGEYEQHIFCLVKSEPATWEFLFPASPKWDSVHQKIHWAGKVTSLSQAELPPGTPSVPEPPEGPYPSRESFSLGPETIPDKRFPLISTYLDSKDHHSAKVWVVLSEDTYETSFGDGQYHFLHSVYLTEEQASEAASQTDEYERRHIREMTIAIENNSFTFPDFQLKLFDHYEPLRVLTLLEEKL